MVEGTATAGSFGPNEWLVEEMYERYLADPASVGPSWQEFFANYRQSTAPPRSAAATAPSPPPPPPPAPSAVPPPAPAVAPAPGPAGDGDVPQVLKGVAARTAVNME